jgi:hypothetical protein
MFQCQGMILESRMQIRLRKMPRVSGLREKAQVCETEFFNHTFLRFKDMHVMPAAQGRMKDKQHSERDPAQRNKDQEKR